jgi:hypothetical protein
MQRTLPTWTVQEVGSALRLHVNDEEDGKLIVTIPTSSAAR